MKKEFSCFILIILLVLGACSEKEPDNNNEDVPLIDVVYGEHSRQKLDIILPESASFANRAPVMFFVHGGSWSAGDKTDFEFMASLTNSYGYAYVSINYRLLQDGVRYTDMLDDLHSALLFLRENSDKYPIRTDKIAVMGSSAGGHLALLYSYSKNSPINIAFVVSQVGPTDFQDPVWFQSPFAQNYGLLNLLTGTNITEDQIKAPNFTFPQEWILASPVHYAKNGLPPTILAYGEKDDIVPYSNGLRLRDKLTEVEVANDFVGFPNSGHDLANDNESILQLSQLILQYATIYLPVK